VKRNIAVALCALGVLASAPQSDAATRWKITSPGDNASIRNATPGSVGNGYVIGAARNGWTFDEQYHDSSSSGWAYGYIWGNFNHCGWVYNGNYGSSQGSTSSRCPGSPSYNYPYTDFTSSLNCQPGTCSDGSVAHINYTASGCTRPGSAYPNVNPFAVPANPTDYYGQLPNGRTVYWRYVSKDGHWVMVRDPYYLSESFNISPPANWFFVAHNCLNFY